MVAISNSIADTNRASASGKAYDKRKYTLKSAAIFEPSNCLITLKKCLKMIIFIKIIVI